MSWLWIMAHIPRKLEGGELLEESREEISGKIENLMLNEACGGGIYLSSLILSRHWRFELRKRGSRVWI
jgi:hypothetical protein